MESEEIKDVRWIGSSQDDLRELPDEIRATFGYALYEAQIGGKSKHASPMKGFGSANVLEIVEDARSGTYRAIYTVRFGDIIYVLHVFQKKSKKGIATPKQEVDLIQVRLKDAERDYDEYINRIKQKKRAYGKKK